VDIVIDTVDGYASESPDLAQAKARALRLGFKGGLQHRYGSVDSPDFTVAISWYAGAQGAHDDLARVYQPGEVQNPPEDVPIISPIQLGDETVARLGTGPNSGTTELTWRHGGVLFDLQHDGNPGEAPLAQMAALARTIDALYTQHPPS
jgi:hypothetical protein